MSSTPDFFRDVSEFHALILGVFPPSTPTLVSTDYCVERSRFLAEELTEFTECAVAGDIVGTADALADIIYVALGTAYAMRLPFDDIWRAVHTANMQKVRGSTKRGNAVDAMKPAGWQSPEPAIARAIQRRVEDAPTN